MTRRGIPVVLRELMDLRVFVETAGIVGSTRPLWKLLDGYRKRGERIKELGREIERERADHDRGVSAWEFRERRALERVAALEHEVKLLRAYWDSECGDHADRSCKVWCSQCRENAEAVAAVQAHEREKLTAHDTKQGQGGDHD